MILDRFRDFAAYAVRLEVVDPPDGRQFYALGDADAPRLFRRRLAACRFRDELAPHLRKKARVVKVRVRIEEEGR